MATKIFPTVNDINGGVSGQGKTLTEANLKALNALPYFDKPYVKSGAAGSNGGGLNLTVASGHYMIGGYWVYKDAGESVLLTASQTNRVWLQLAVDGSGNVNGTNWVVRTDATVPSGQPAVLTQIVVTGASTITTITDTYRGIIAPGKLIVRATATTDSAGAGDKLSIAAPGDGQTNVVVNSYGTVYTSGGAGTGLFYDIRDGAGGTGTRYQRQYEISPGAGSTVVMNPTVPVAAYAVARTFYLNLGNTGGTPTAADASYGTTRILEARWDI